MEFLVLVLFEPLKSAEPPISSGKSSEKTSIADEEWGKRLVALIRLKSSCTTQENIKVFRELKGLVKDWLPAERPIKWYECQTLKVNRNGKWDLKKWNNWIKNVSEHISSNFLSDNSYSIHQVIYARRFTMIS